MQDRVITVIKQGNESPKIWNSGEAPLISTILAPMPELRTHQALSQRRVSRRKAGSRALRALFITRGGCSRAHMRGTQLPRGDRRILESAGREAFAD